MDIISKLVRKLGITHKLHRGIGRHGTATELCAEVGQFEVSFSVDSDPEVAERRTIEYAFSVSHPNGFNRTFVLKSYQWLE